MIFYRLRFDRVLINIIINCIRSTSNCLSFDNRRYDVYRRRTYKNELPIWGSVRRHKGLIALSVWLAYFNDTDFHKFDEDLRPPFLLSAKQRSFIICTRTYKRFWTSTSRRVYFILNGTKTAAKCYFRCTRTYPNAFDYCQNINVYTSPITN